jgi:sugar phosphate isomerase/epimerase
MSAELLGSYWTTAGPVEIHTGREWSLFDWVQRCAHAARVGMAGLGLWHADLIHLLERHSVGELKRIFEDHGLGVLEVEFLGDWFAPEGTPARRASDELRKLLFDAASELDAHHIKVGNIVGTPCERSRLIDEYGRLCADAATRHGAPMVYEPMPPDVNVHSLDVAVALMEGAAAANGGLAIDFWHLGKLGVTPDQLRAIPPRYLSYVELSDGTVADMPDPVEETTKFRRLPGEGEFNVVGYARVLRELGYQGPWGVEVLSEELRNRPITEIFDRAARSSRTVLAEAGA